MKAFRFVIIAVVALFALVSNALAMSAPPTAQIVKVKKSVIRVQGLELGGPVASGGYGGGSGVVFQIDYDKGIAYALTNHHVSGDSPASSVRFWNGAEYKANMISREPGIDVALLEIHGIPDERNLPDDKKTIIAATLGDSDKVQVGDHAVGMGSPGSRDGFRTNLDDPYQDFMLQQTVTDGVVTGRDSVIEFEMEIWEGNRSNPNEGDGGLGMQYGTNFPYAFRITVPINPGNSGGPLFNDKGEVIGLNFYGGSNTIMQNENHSVPINPAKDFAYQFLNTGKFEKPWLGLDVLFPPYVMSTSQYKEFLDKRKDSSLIQVFNVRQGSPADKAGFKKGDVVESVEGRKFASAQDLRLFVFSQPIGQRLSFEVKRGGSKLKGPLDVEVQPKRNYDAEFSI